MRWASAMIMGVCVAAAACAPQEAVQAPAKSVDDAALMKQLEEIDSRTGKIRDLSADFEQKKFTTLLKHPMVSTGRVRVRGTVVRWDTVKPEPSVMRIDERELRIYYPSQKVVEVYSIGEDLRRLSSSPLPRLENIARQFSIARMEAKELDAGADPAKVLAIVMTPTVEALKEHVRTVKVLIDIGGAYASRMEITDADGERTLIVFSKVKVNSGLSEGDVEMDVPRGVTVVRPLSGSGEKR